MEWRCTEGSGASDESRQHGTRSVADGEEQSVHQGTRVGKRLEDVRKRCIRNLAGIAT